MITIDHNNRRRLGWWLRFFSFNNEGVYIAKRSNISALTDIGYGTRINGKITIKGAEKAVIGKYCAIGADVKIITSNHDTSYMNLQYSLQCRIGIPAAIHSIGSVTLGHNVWIGDSAIILPGVSIGNGAVVGAGAIVTKNVSSYSIIGCNPAKIIRYRFSEKSREKIENLRWWEWSEEKMRENSDLFKVPMN